MLNRDIYLKDPAERKLVNQGVASVNDDASAEALAVLRYELETFVCDGQYEKGLAHILDTFLRNIDQPQQPGVWISGFFGSGKSHLVKMMRALWQDAPFPDGATPRGIADLPASVADPLKELSAQGKRHGGLHAASGTLGAGATGSVRLALLRIIFKSAGLPEGYPVARFVMWLMKEGRLQEVRDAVEAAGYDWQEELDNFYVADGIADALIAVWPDRFASRNACVETLTQMFPAVSDVSSDDMIKTIRQSLTRDGKFPLTLVVLDEVQQYIGSDPQRSMDVQETVEACSKNIGGKLLFVGTGQTAVTGTANLARLQGRFTVLVELSDADVEAVIRKVILAKKPETIPTIADTMGRNLGEISRHLQGTTIAHRPEDQAVFPQDYPLLPVRRRFWEAALKVLDQTGTAAQLRNQLSVVHKVIQTNLDEPLGSVVPADFVFFDSAENLLQMRQLPRKVYEKTSAWMRGNEEQQLMARACALVFLINKVAAANTELGVRATVDSLADLLVVDLPAGSSALRSRLPAVLDACELLIRVDAEYRIQTEESAAWNDSFMNQRANLASQAHTLEHERDTRIRKMFADTVGRLSLTQGAAKVSREVSPLFDAELPKDADQRIYVWVRDGWSTDENTVKAEARQAGSASPTVFLYLPKRHGDDLRNQLMEYKAARNTIDERGTPGASAAADTREAFEAMQTTLRNAENRIQAILRDCFNDARVYQGGGTEVVGSDLAAMLREAADSALLRLYPQFGLADNAGWSKVFDNARKGAPDALKAVGEDGEADKNPVCKAVLGFIAGGKTGAEVRARFEGAPYGWSGDAVDGALFALLVAGALRAQDERGQPVEFKTLERKAIGKTGFRVEATTITATQRIQIRKLLQLLEVNARPNEELASVAGFLEKLRVLSERVGGEAPKPASPDVSVIDDLRRSVGNEQLQALHNQRDTLAELIEQWKDQSARIESRWPAWLNLKQLTRHAEPLDATEAIRAQVAAIEASRQLLAEPDPVPGLANELTQALREQLNRHAADYAERHGAGMNGLDADPNWAKLEPEQRNALLAAQKLTLADTPAINVQTTEDVLASLQAHPLPGLADRIAALPGRFAQVAEEAALLCEPKVQFVPLPQRTLQNADEVDAWAAEAAAALKSALANGPVRPR
ncbi:BREX system P-loop protein BrxC [Pseudoxanthomonas kaohsiungensis]|uniref:BREX system P-loop protein BrxC n=1 Tax=Pseudoxanthomonas kaohsiungensis TaxID=283923 RepID=A0ABW3LR29_9GAMM|nr:BREX system P-loop protein BrxC [Pseudoxanthomonas kaohsiungensis]KAF1704224.1 hypothetical protein CSC66_05075 [Pseudoxanthomonas kaohsiungensis]